MSESEDYQKSCLSAASPTFHPVPFILAPACLAAASAADDVAASAGTRKSGQLIVAEH